MITVDSFVNEKVMSMQQTDKNVSKHYKDSDHPKQLLII